jgi:hypothetical protein
MFHCKARLSGCAAFIVACLVGFADAQTPPKGAAPTDDAIVHSPGELSSPSQEDLSSQLQLTVAQKTAILNAIHRENLNRLSPTNFPVSVGAPVPPSTELYDLPDSVLKEVPAAKAVKYTKLETQIVLIDPVLMRVVDILRE